MAAKKVSPMLKVLVEIRDELRSTGKRLDGRIDGLGVQVDGLAQEMRESNVRVASELVAVSGAVLSVRDLLLERLDDRERLDAVERRVLVLEQKVS
jgi:hypothetical protein